MRVEPLERGQIGGSTRERIAAHLESYYADAGFQTRVDGSHRFFDTEATTTVQRRVDREMNEKPARHDATPGVGGHSQERDGRYLFLVRIPVAGRGHGG